MRIETDIKLDFKDVLIRPQPSSLSSRKEVDLTARYQFLHSCREFIGIPIIGANMDGVGNFAMAEALHAFGATVALRKHYPFSQLIQFIREKDFAFDQWFSFGILDRDLEKLDMLISSLGHQRIRICLDVANGYMDCFVAAIRKVRARYPNITIMAGNVVTAEMTKTLIKAGTDLVKVGLGSGAGCLTRNIAGVGYPQLSAIAECVSVAKAMGALVCSDGGCQVPGDLAKAFGAGADFVMLGGMLAGHKEGGDHGLGDEPNRSTVPFYGMSSGHAQLTHEGEQREYRASEGRVVDIEYRGTVARTMTEILGGLRSACTYVGAHDISELSERVTFIRVTQQLNPMFG